ncbi:hypothetical protein PFISCL1PPCAC_21495, partial [Pristionchus fissidentatus]
TGMSSVPARFRKCESCDHNLFIPREFESSPATPCHVLSCGHIFCDRCTIRHLSTHGNMWCRTCDLSRPISPSILEQTPVLNNKLPQRSIVCVGHREERCPCGEMVCLLCTTGSHADHFQYQEFCVSEETMKEKLKLLRRLKGALLDERRETAKRKTQIHNSIFAAKNEIASKSTLIIAQAISRCLYLMAQLAKLGAAECRELDERDARITTLFGSIIMATDLSNRSKLGSNFSDRSDTLKEAIAVANMTAEEYKELKAIRRFHPVVNVAYSATDDTTLDHIARFGKLITTNLIDGNYQQVDTCPTPLVRTKSTAAASTEESFTRFYQVFEELNKFLNFFKELIFIGRKRFSSSDVVFVVFDLGEVQMP